MTRTKPKNAKPFFNAGTERFIRDWRNTEVMISVRDSRERENDALLGIIYLPLNKVFAKRCQVMDMYPLVGGMGFGRARVSMVFRSVKLQLQKELLGWDYGTLEVTAPIKAKSGFPQNLQSDRMKIRTNIMRAKLAAANGEWRPKKDKESVFLAVRKRYAMPLIVEFRQSAVGRDSTPAFAVLWLKDIADEEETTISMKVWNGGKQNLKRATTCAAYAGIEDGEQPLGEIEVTMKFWRGLSGYHKSYAMKGKNSDVRGVIEVLDTVNDEIEKDNKSGNDETFESSDDSDSDSSGSHISSDTDTLSTRKVDTKPKELATHPDDDSDCDSDPQGDDSSTHNPLKLAQKKVHSVLDGHNAPDDGERGVVAQIKDYKDHRKQLHRKHRGIMQWKAARSLDWAVGRAGRAKSKVGEVFEHQETGGPVEREV
jgi:hypothetical protein